jgi:hypothetical protein
MEGFLQKSDRIFLKKHGGKLEYQPSILEAVTNQNYSAIQNLIDMGASPNYYNSVS